MSVTVQKSSVEWDSTRAKGDWRGHRVVLGLREPPDDEVRVGFEPGDIHLLV